jgi:hypothetical protein
MDRYLVMILKHCFQSFHIEDEHPIPGNEDIPPETGVVFAEKGFSLKFGFTD